ncbi:hypothetical protein BHM03_00031440 [Ensete ventricosum]|nr:hypothetical protein BHM03_00031440 [Ensete ventricosum]
MVLSLDHISASRAHPSRSTLLPVPPPISSGLFSSPLIDRSIDRASLRSAMAYVDRAFSISDESMTMDGAYVVHHRPPVKEIALAVGLLVLGTLGVVLGIIMATNEVGGDRTHGNPTRLPLFPKP